MCVVFHGGILPWSRPSTKKPLNRAGNLSAASRRRRQQQHMENRTTGFSCNCYCCCYITVGDKYICMAPITSRNYTNPNLDIIHIYRSHSNSRLMCNVFYSCLIWSRNANYECKNYFRNMRWFFFIIFSFSHCWTVMCNGTYWQTNSPFTGRIHLLESNQNVSFRFDMCLCVRARETNTNWNFSFHMEEAKLPAVLVLALQYAQLQLCFFTEHLSLYAMYPGGYECRKHWTRTLKLERVSMAKKETQTDFTNETKTRERR